MSDRDLEMERMKDRLSSMENRLSRLESALLKGKISMNNFSDEQPEEVIKLHISGEEESRGLESQIGQFGLAWTGNLVLLFGITFFTQYLMNLGYLLFSAILGYLAVTGIYFLSNYLKRTNDHLAFMFRMNSQVLLFYITLRLYFFSATPILPSKTIVIILLMMITALQVLMAVRNKSKAFAVLSVFFALSTAVVCDSGHLMLAIAILAATGSCYYYYRFSWGPMLLATIALIYITFFLWIAGNPLMGHPMKLLREQDYGAFYLFGIGTCFSMLLLLRTKDDSSDDFLTGMTFINGFLFTFLLGLVVLVFFSKNYVGIFSVITVCCLIYSIILHFRSDWKFASAFYALYGFMAMSIALYGMVGFPKVYLLLSVQSLIVVSMALWFRNRLIIIMNSMLFSTILLVYLLSSKSSDQINFAFASIALVSARIINWKRNRLQIETDLIRNLYMIAGFFMVLFALGHAVPKQFITLSWAMAALLYFFLGYVLKNKKYRLMALGTIICATFYLFIFDLARIEIIYRVLALLFLAAASIGISMYYTNRIKKQNN